MSRLLVSMTRLTTMILCLAMVAPPLAAQASTPATLFAGIVLSDTQKERIDTIEKKYKESESNLDKDARFANRHTDSTTQEAYRKLVRSLYGKSLKERRSLLTPDQRKVYDKNAEVDSLWKQQGLAMFLLARSQRSERSDSLEKQYDKVFDHHCEVMDSLLSTNTVLTPQQLQQRWEDDLQKVRSLLTATEQQKFDEIMRNGHP